MAGVFVAPLTASIVIVSKDEPKLDDTLAAVEGSVPGLAQEIVVVDASSGRLAHVQNRHPQVTWIDFNQPPDRGVTIGAQRNTGVRATNGEAVVFIDCGCIPADGWLERLLAPIAQEGEALAGGPMSRPGGQYNDHQGAPAERYADALPTGNLAFRREVFDALDGFDESFAYGSDIDFCWRAGKAGYRIRFVPEAVVDHDWGTTSRRVRRSFDYGVARARLYRKHRDRIRDGVRTDPMPFAYAAFLALLPLSVKYRWYPLLLLVPLWRNRHRPDPVWTLVDHVLHGAGALAEWSGLSAVK
jgi:GT2 family glycosyltransferase